MKNLAAFLLLLVLAFSSAHAALTKVGTGDSDDDNGSTSTSRTLTKDSGLSNGCVIVLAVAYYEDTSDAALTAPTGATFVDHGSTVFEGTGSAESRLHIYSRVVDGTESASFVVARTNQFFGTAQMVSLCGATALSVASVNVGTPSGGAVGSIAAPSVSISATQGIAAVFALSDPPGAYTDPSGMTLGISEPTEATTTGRIYFESPSAGSTGTRTLSWATPNRDALGVMIVINGANTGTVGCLLCIRRRH